MKEDPQVIHGTGNNIRYLVADSCPSLELAPDCQGQTRLYLFSDDHLDSLCPTARSERRSKSRGTLLLGALIRDLQQTVPLNPNTGVYLFCGPGPSNPKTQQAVLSLPARQRASVIERLLPPKDYFISNPAMKAAQISIDFQLHGPWTAFTSPIHGVEQAFLCAHNDLLDGVVEAVLVGGIFALDEPPEISNFLPAQELVESVLIQYSTHCANLLATAGPLGRYGPLTSALQAAGHGR